jgi:uncharacterized alpha-E superfamily protein
MLSRVANRLYWLARYIERAENTARLINVNSNLLFDLPSGTRLGWHTLIEIVSSEQKFDALGLVADERNIIKFMISDLENPTSISSSLHYARENARTAREIIPTEAWEKVNSVYLNFNDALQLGLGRRVRYQTLQEVISECQQLTGLLAGTMSHSVAYTFLRLGRNLERADMTSRIIDMGSNYLLPHLLKDQEASEETTLYEDILWMNILISLSAYQMYRQHVRNRVTGSDVVKFTLSDIEFPRSAAHCLNELQICLDKLPRSKSISQKIIQAKNKLATANFNSLTTSGLHDFIDQLQKQITSTDNEINSTWFKYES